MDKLPASLRPHEIGMGVNVPLLEAILRHLAHHVLGLGATLRQPHVGEIGIEQVLSTLVILDVGGTERTVQFLRRDAQLLGYLSVVKHEIESSTLSE